jgi:hypothetical protein
MIIPKIHFIHFLSPSLFCIPKTEITSLTLPIKPYTEASCNSRTYWGGGLLLGKLYDPNRNIEAQSVLRQAMTSVSLGSLNLHADNVQ